MAHVEEGKMDWNEIEENLKQNGVTVIGLLVAVSEAPEPDFSPVKQPAVLYNNPFFGHEAADVPEDLLPDPNQEKEEPAGGSDQSRVHILQKLNKESAQQPAEHQEQRPIDPQSDHVDEDKADEEEVDEDRENKSPVIRKTRPKSRRRQATDSQKLAQLFHPHPTEGWIQPDLTLSLLITMAIMSTPHKRIRVSQIYDYITSSFPYYRTCKKLWRNSIRHCLSQKAGLFGKAESSLDLHKGWRWTFNQKKIKWLESEIKKRRLHDVRLFAHQLASADVLKDLTSIGLLVQ